jgi:uridine kinase
MTTDGISELVDLIAKSSRDRIGPLIVAIDGRSGAGKSTLAAAVATEVGAAVIDGDDFYSGGTAAQWDAMTPSDRARHCIDWRRQRSVLEPIARGEEATWHPYDWDTDDGRLSDRALSLQPPGVVILEGAYSARPELADLMDLRVMLDVPDQVREQRLRVREGEHYRKEWESRWASAEEYYFENVMPPAAFDLVLDGRSRHRHRSL